jgi:hypothetical protein
MMDLVCNSDRDKKKCIENFGEESSWKAVTCKTEAMGR